MRSRRKLVENKEQSKGKHVSEKTKTEETLSPLEGENRFLTRLVLGLACVAVVSWSYTFYFQSAVVGPAADSMNSGTAEGYQQGAELLTTTHFFSNVVSPESLVPANDPMLGAQKSVKDFVDGERETNLYEKAGKNAETAAIKSVEKSTGELIDTLRKSLEAPKADDADKATYIRTTAPAFAGWMDLERTKFASNRVQSTSGSLTKAGSQCASFAPCLRGYIEATHPRLATYLRIRDSRSGLTGEMSPYEMSRGMSFPTALLLAFSQDNTQKPFSEQEERLARSLLIGQEMATQNGFIFSVFLTLVFFICGGVRFLSGRVKPDGYV